jgi:hypothetical protein
LPQPPVTTTYYQKIDHSTPRYYESVTYPPRVVVNTTANISVRLKDDYGNIIDDRRENDVHNVSFTEAIRSDSGFGAIGTHAASIPVDVTGNATVTYYVSKLLVTTSFESQLQQQLFQT